MTTTETNEIGACTCQCSDARRLYPSVHDDLVAMIEAAMAGTIGFGGVTSVLDYCAETIGGTSEDGHLSWVDLPDFIAEHNWSKPAEAVVFSRSLDELIRRADA